MPSVIDLSRWQAGISLGAIARDGHAAVIIKATQGTGYVSSSLSAQVAGARAAGLPVGLYHFCDSSDPAAQARHFLSVAGPLVRRGIEPLIFDFEGEGATHAGLDVMRRAVRAAGHRTATYTGGYWDTAGSSTCAECADDPLWLAAYRSTQPAPKRPWTRVALWQRTDAARVTGWAAGVDLSSTDDLTALFGNTTTPPEDDMSQADVDKIKTDLEALAGSEATRFTQSLQRNDEVIRRGDLALGSIAQVSLQIAGLTAAVQAMAGATSGVDPEQVAAAVQAAVDKALADLKVTLVPGK